MGCGGSKQQKVAPNDKPGEQKDASAASPPPAANPKPKVAVTGPGSSDDGQGATQKESYSRGTSFVVDMNEGRPATTGRMPPRLRKHLATPKNNPTRDQLEEKQRSAEKRREEKLDEKRDVAAKADIKVSEAKGRQDDKEQGIKFKLERENTIAQQNRERINEQKKESAAKSEAKGRKARVRRHELAMQQAAELESGGAVQSSGGDDDKENEDKQEW